MKNTRLCPKCGSQNIVRYVCCDCGYVENWVETQSERNEIKRTFG